MTNSNFGFFDINNSPDTLREQYKEFLQNLENLRKELKPRIARFDLEGFYKEKEQMCGCQNCKEKRDSKNDEQE